LYTLAQYTARVQYAYAFDRPREAVYISAMTHSHNMRYFYLACMLGWLVGLLTLRGRLSVLSLAAAVSPFPSRDPVASDARSCPTSRSLQIFSRLISEIVALPGGETQDVAGVAHRLMGNVDSACRTDEAAHLVEKEAVSTADFEELPLTVVGKNLVQRFDPLAKIQRYTNPHND
jgi:hypothetical protein